MSEPSQPRRDASASPVFAERRRHVRRSVAFAVRYRRIDPNDLAGCQQEYRHGVCRNVSDGGMLLEIDGHVPHGQILEVYGSDIGQDKTLFAIVETVRAARSPEHYEVGVRFLRRQEF
jgi:c-di-GMP-binding flagellar brake protein YcgR